MKYKITYKMKLTFLVIFLSTITTFITTYFFNLTMSNYEQYLALTTVVFADGFFGILAGIKREGFKTYKALRILKTLATWIVLLTIILIVENGIEGAGWLSETILIPYIAFEMISILKNASMVGLIQADLLNKILDEIDKHKGYRDTQYIEKPKRGRKPKPSEEESHSRWE